MDLEKIVKDSLKNIVFLELKSKTKVGNIELDTETPLPINLNSLIGGIKKGELSENISIEVIDEAIVYLLGIEPDFKYSDDYVKIINSTIKNLKEYIMYLSYMASKNSNYIDSYIYIKSAELLLEYDEEVEFTKINIIEKIYNENLNKLKDDEKSKLLKDIINGYENILKVNDKNSLCYYRLGFINQGLKNYLKSKLYFEKFLNTASEDMEVLKNEVRDNLQELEDYANIETSQTYISYGKFQDAYKILQKVSDLYPNKDELYYLFSICQYNLGFKTEALNSIEEAIKINEKIENYYNQKSICLISLGEESLAVENYKQAIDLIEDSYILNYNLGMLLFNIGNIEYKEYLKKAYHISPNDELLKIVNEL